MGWRIIKSPALNLKEEMHIWEMGSCYIRAHGAHIGGTVMVKYIYWPVDDMILRREG